MRISRLVLLLIPLSGAMAARQDIPFERYQIIIDRAPFGSLPASRAEGSAANANQPAGPSFADSLRVSSIIEDSQTGLKRVCLVDEQKKKSFQFILGDTNNVSSDEGYELLSVDYDKGEVVIRQGGQQATVLLSSGGKSARPPGPVSPAGPAMMPRGGPPVPVPGNPGSYAQRREVRGQQPRALPQQAPPAYTGEALQQHLSDYKMDVIRQGLPALPIPLTQEEDAQLVKEGVLPPQP